MTVVKVALRRGAAVCLAGGAVLAVCLALVVVSSAGAAADVRVTAIDCLLHPRKIAIQNAGDTAQDLAGWKLLSDKPNEVFDLGVAKTILPVLPDTTNAVYIFNGHLSKPEPYFDGKSWQYSWNYTKDFDESAFVLREDGKDFIRLVDATQFPWREVSSMPCPGTTEIPPLQQPETPTPPPSNPNPGAGDNTGQTDGDQATSAQTDGAQSTGARQSVPSANTTAGSGTGSTAQTGNVSGQAAGGPASGAGALELQVAGGQPLNGHLLALSVLGVVAGAALALVGVRMMRRALRRP